MDKTLNIVMSDTQKVYPDLYILRLLLDTHLYPQGRPTFDYRKFEDSHGTTPLSEKYAEYHFFKKYHPDMQAAAVSIRGRTLWTMSNSLLPDNPIVAKNITADLRDHLEEQSKDKDYLLRPKIQQELESVPESRLELETRQSIAYLLGRVMARGLLRKYRPGLTAHCLDPFTNALFFLYTIALTIKQQVRWLHCLHGPSDQRLPATRFTSLSLVPDSILDARQRDIIGRFRAEINLLVSDEMLRLATYLLHEDRSLILSRSLVSRVMKKSKSTVRHRTDFLFTRRFIVNPYVFGAQYRFIFLPSDEKFLALPRSHNSLATAYHLIESEYGSLQVHLEPAGVDGPDDLPTGSYSTVVDREFVSMRYDLLDPDTKKWSVAPWKMRGPPYPSDRTCIIRGRSTVDTVRKRPLPEKEFSTLCRLGWHFAPRESQEILLQWLGHVRPDRHREQFLEEGIFNILHHPRLELISLPECIVFSISDSSRTEVESLIGRFIETFPFVRVLLSGDGRNMVAFARLPMNSASLRKAYFMDKKEVGIEITAAVIRSERSSYLTLPTRLYPYLRERTDPWSKERVRS